MKTKRIIFLLVLTQSIFLFNCKKDSTQNESTLQNMSEVLTKDTLKFESYIVNWNTSSERTIYKRGANGNTWNLDNAWYKFDKDSTYKSFFEPAWNYNSNWMFLENGKKLKIWDTTLNANEEVTLLKLTKDTVEWVDPNNNLFYRFVPR